MVVVVSSAVEEVPSHRRINDLLGYRGMRGRGRGRGRVFGRGRTFRGSRGGFRGNSNNPDVSQLNAHL